MSAAEVRRAIQAAVDYLKTQGGNGTWAGNAQYTGGVTSLATLALLNAGLPSTDPLMASAIRRVNALNDEWVYVVSLRIAVLAAADPRLYKADIARSADWLVTAQLPGGDWTYTGRNAQWLQLRGDNSNTQFALLGLHEAARAGVPIPRRVWTLAEQHWTKCQRRDGGWSYVSGDGVGVTGSMTAAGVASLLICGHQLNQSLERGYTEAGTAPGCGKYAQSRHVTSGLRWLADNFSPRQNPGTPQWHYYWLYGAERVGILSGVRFFGRHDWYREGAAYLVSQQLGDGSWNRSPIDTSFALLFLAKGRRPVLINKLAWSRDNRWQPDRYDCEHLIAFIGDKLGGPVAWQAVSVDGPLRNWQEAPILYVSGHTFPNLSVSQRNRMRQFVEQGGTIFAEACCSRDAFAAGFADFAEKTFEGASLVNLDADHPVWKAYYDLKPGRFPLRGLDLGCRTSVIFSPRDLSCLWEQGDVESLSDEAYKLGTNIAAYATGREPLRDRLEAVELPMRRTRPKDAVPPRGAVQLVQLIHNGDWRPDIESLTHLAELLRTEARVDVVAQPRLLRPTDPDLRDHPIAYMTGHFAFTLDAAEKKALREWLERGGTLIAESCCGRTAFDTSFRRLAGELFPQSPLTPLPKDHPVIAGNPGYELKSVAYRPAVLKEHPGLRTVVLEGVEIDGRTAILYSPYGFGCGLHGHQCYACRGLIQEDARKLAVNLVLYALAY